MSYLAVLCEGETEMDFVREVLSEHLNQLGIGVHQILLGKKLKHDVAESPGGVFRYEPVFKHINATLRQFSSPTSFVTTMLDLYAFPRDFPDYEKLVCIADPYERVAAFEASMKFQVNSPRFLPNVQLHEFEALIYTDPKEILAEFPEGQPHSGLAALVTEVGDMKPEEINQTKEGAPSKRLLRCIPGYRKRTMGPSILKRIGWNNLKSSCPHFAAWLANLETLASDGAPQLQ